MVSSLARDITVSRAAPITFNSLVNLSTCPLVVEAKLGVACYFQLADNNWFNKYLASKLVIWNGQAPRCYMGENETR